MKVGDKVLILDTAREEDYNNGDIGPGWAWDMGGMVNAIGYIADLHDDIARVIFHKVSPGEHTSLYEGRWWRLSDLKNLEVNKWRRQVCQ